MPFDLDFIISNNIHLFKWAEIKDLIEFFLIKPSINVMEPKRNQK